jgi:hypothetical protein
MYVVATVAKEDSESTDWGLLASVNRMVRIRI